MNLRGKKENVNPKNTVRKVNNTSKPTKSQSEDSKRRKTDCIVKSNENVPAVKKPHILQEARSTNKPTAKATRSVLGVLQESLPKNEKNGPLNSAVKETKAEALKPTKKVQGDLEKYFSKDSVHLQKRTTEICSNKASALEKEITPSKDVEGSLNVKLMERLNKKVDEVAPRSKGLKPTESIISSCDTLLGRKPSKKSNNEQGPTKKAARKSNNKGLAKSDKRKVSVINKTGKQKKVLLDNVRTKELNIPEDCFGFNSGDSDEDTGPYNDSLTTFDPSRPFRLALYVHPSKRPRIDPRVLKKYQSLCPTFNITNISNISSNVTSSVFQNRTNLMSPVRPVEAFKVPASSTPNRTHSVLENMPSPIRPAFKVPISSTPMEKKKKSKLVQPKITAVFQPCPKRTRADNGDKKYTSFFETSGNSIDETNRRRSYVKKSRPAEVMEHETSSDEILKSLEKTKKKTKTKKKNEKADDEFEKWSRSINSEFDEVEKFEVSFD